MNIVDALKNKPAIDVTEEEIDLAIAELLTINSTIKVLDKKKDNCDAWVLLIDCDFKESLLSYSAANDDGYRRIGRIIAGAKESTDKKIENNGLGDKIQRDAIEKVTEKLKAERNGKRRTHALTGDTYDVKEILKNDFNASWNAEKKVWKVGKSNAVAAQKVIDDYAVEKVADAEIFIKEELAKGIEVEDKDVFKDDISALIDMSAISDHARWLKSDIRRFPDIPFDLDAYFKEKMGVVLDAKNALAKKGLCLIAIEKITSAKNTDEILMIDAVDFTNICLIENVEEELKKSLMASKNNAIKKEQEKLDLEEEERILDEQLRVQKEEKQQKIRIQIKKISTMIDYEKVREQARIMIKNHNNVGSSARISFRDAAEIIYIEKEKLEEKGFFTKALRRLNSANFNRPGRDNLNLLSDEDFYILQEI